MNPRCSCNEPVDPKKARELLKQKVASIRALEKVYTELYKDAAKALAELSPELLKEKYLVEAMEDAVSSPAIALLHTRGVIG
jgi:hypothetical protein